MFLFQAEDGIRDYKVTGVQTCALPISPSRVNMSEKRPCIRCEREIDAYAKICPYCNWDQTQTEIPPPSQQPRSEERRVGKEGTAARAAGQGSEEQERPAGEGAPDRAAG